MFKAILGMFVIWFIYTVIKFLIVLLILLILGIGNIINKKRVNKKF